MAKAIPEGYRALTPYIVVDGANDAIEFYVRNFGGRVSVKLDSGDLVGHAEIIIGDSMLMIADAQPDMGWPAPAAGAALPMSLVLYTEDVDAVFARCIEEGAEEVRPVEDQFYGDRSGTIRDPWGHFWTIATHIEDVSEAEMKERMSRM
ncbi:MAG: VOC family protein [Acidobacteria bacterium]|nr:VOC family protein [Acidobacteriota bacterium]